MGQGPFYRVARIGRQPGRGGFACRAGGRCGVSQGKLVLVAAEALCLDIAGRYRSVLKIGAFDWALYLKALTAGTTEGGWDLPVSEIRSGRADSEERIIPMARLAAKLESGDGSWIGAATARGSHRDGTNRINKEQIRESRKAVTWTFVERGLAITACLRKTGFIKYAAYPVPVRRFYGKTPGKVEKRTFPS
jgi:hypothetical protein